MGSTVPDLAPGVDDGQSEIQGQLRKNAGSSAHRAGVAGTADRV